ncbi:DnaD domain protein, partial [Streptococcus suis]|nr:DnaD domain protein [Streptococcus suis]
GVFRNKPVWNYIKAILRNWKNDKLLTVELVRARQQEQELPKNVDVSPEFLEAMNLWKD